MDWLPAVTSSAVVAALGAAGLWAAKLAVEKNLQAAFDRKLEEIKAENRKKEEELKAELRAQEALLEHIRKNAVSGAAARQAIVDKRRLDAIERVWNHVCATGTVKMAVQLLQVIKLDEFLDRASQSSDGIREFAKILYEAGKFEEIAKGHARSEQPYLLPSVWAYYSAQQAVVGYANVILMMAKSGLNPEFLSSSDALNALVVTALPHQKAFLEQHPSTGIFFLVDELEKNILSSIQESLAGKEADEAMVRQAAAIDKMAQEVTAQANIAVQVPQSMRE